MRTAAAKRKNWRLIAASLAALLAAGAAEASRFTPSAVDGPLEKEQTSSLAATRHAADLASAVVCKTAPRVPLLTAAERTALTAPHADELEAALTSAPAELWVEKLASGGQIWGLRPDLNAVFRFTTISHPSRFGYTRVSIHQLKVVYDATHPGARLKARSEADRMRRSDPGNPAATLDPTEDVERTE